MRYLKMKWIALAALLILIPAVISIALWVNSLQSKVKERLSGRRFSAPTEFYSLPERFQKGYHKSILDVTLALKRTGMLERPLNQMPLNGQYSRWENNQCAPALPPELRDTIDECIAFKLKNSKGIDSALSLVAFHSDVILDVFSGTPLATAPFLDLAPELFAQFYGADPILRTEVELGQVPPLCLNALLAIEDADFLEHKGVSPLGMARAFLKNILRGHVAQGGSTITQQLVKNYFLTPERTMKRKFTEIAMALLLEGDISKDDILETYINEIYMGQNGPFQVLRFGAAATHYFGTGIEELDLAQCALLAAIVNNPGRYNPVTHRDDAQKRRSRVLDRMVELKILSQSEADAARAQPLPQRPERILSEPAPYFVEAVRSELKKREIDLSEGLKIYTTMNLREQEAAQTAVRNGLTELEKSNKTIQKIHEKGKSLEGALISADPTRGFVHALVGGRAFKMSQFNRATQSRRQVGSIVKPVVYLAALESLDETGRPYTPISLIADERMHVKFDKQEWSPDNYEGQFYGNIPMYFALKSSLNAATAQLGLKVGLDSIIDLARRLGVESPLKAFPALTLGAFELTAFEVLQAYVALERFGDFIPLTLIEHIEDLSGSTIYKYEAESRRVTATENVAVLIGMMRQTVLNGTARYISKSGFNVPAAGKTGTTSDTKDAWFSGFTTYHNAVVWVGYDDNTENGLTGASGAVPIWLEYMKNISSPYPQNEFAWPDSVEKVHLTAETLKALGVPEASEEIKSNGVDLIFKKGTGPTQ